MHGSVTVLWVGSQELWVFCSTMKPWEHRLYQLSKEKWLLVSLANVSQSCRQCFNTLAIYCVKAYSIRNKWTQNNGWKTHCMSGRLFYRPWWTFRIHFCMVSEKELNPRWAWQQSHYPIMQLNQSLAWPFQGQSFARRGWIALHTDGLMESCQSS